LALTLNARSSSASAVRASLTSGKRDIRGMLFAAMLLACMLLALLMLVVLMWDVLVQAIPVFDRRGFGFLRNELGSDPDKVGVSQGLWGSLIIAVS
jgi:ABC-type phosphate transport system permease subunit